MSKTHTLHREKDNFRNALETVIESVSDTLFQNTPNPLFYHLQPLYGNILNPLFENFENANPSLL